MEDLENMLKTDSLFTNLDDRIAQMVKRVQARLANKDVKRVVVEKKDLLKFLGVKQAYADWIPSHIRRHLQKAGLAVRRIDDEHAAILEWRESKRAKRKRKTKVVE